MIASFQSIHALVEGRLGHPIAVCQFDDFPQTPGSGGLWLLEDKEPSSPVLEFTDLIGESDHFDCSTESLFVDFALVGDGERRAGRTHYEDRGTVSSDQSLDFALILWVPQVVLTTGAGVTDGHVYGPSSP